MRRPSGQNLTYAIVEELGQAVVTQAYTDADPFPIEAELCKQFGASRTVLREAVKMLTAKGLLSARPRQGTWVQPESKWNLLDPDVLRWLLERKFSVELLHRFNELRVAIEPEAAALAAMFADQKQLDDIEAGLARMLAAEEGNDNTLDADIAFHVAVLRGSGNPFFMQFRDVVATALRSSIQFTNRIKGRTASVADHAAVRDQIMRRNPAGARTAMRKIIGDVLDLIEAAEAPQKKTAR